MASVNLFFLLDVSWSMDEKDRIKYLNKAVPEALTNLFEHATYQELDVSVRIIYFSDEAEYLYGSPECGVPVKKVIDDWKPLSPIMGTQTHKAIEKALMAMHTKYLVIDGCMDNTICAPIVILFTDGMTNDHDKYIEWIDKMKNTWRTKSGNEGILRIAMGVNEASDDELNEFASEWPTVVRDTATGSESVVKKKQVYHVDDGVDFSGLMSKLVISSVRSSVSGDEESEGFVPLDPDTPAIRGVILEPEVSADLDDFI